MSTTEIASLAARQFAVETVVTLRQAGFQSLWAGGCVRDQLLGKSPKDFDVATNATPDQVRDLFGRRRTIPVGAAFGVITLVGRREQGHIEIATFRRDAAYSDGRHPDSVEFSTAEEDALRRDFTINGLFYDPTADEVIDYVGGQADLRRGVVRAIRDPDERIAEDKLRMLRGVRFAATFEFELERRTQEAIRRHAEALVMVSAERVAQELRRMLVDRHRARAVRLLAETDLLVQVLPESIRFFKYEDGTDLPEQDTWQRTLRVLDALHHPSFATALAALLCELVRRDEPPASQTLTIGGRWRLSNRESQTAAWLLAHEPLVHEAHRRRWAEVQRILIADEASELVELARATIAATGASEQGLRFCQEKLALPREVLDPPPLLTGHDLKRAGLKPGPRFRELLEAIRDEQLEGQIVSPDEAIAWARRKLDQLDRPSTHPSAS